MENSAAKPVSVAALKGYFRESDDFIVEVKELQGESVSFCYLKSLVDTSKVIPVLQDMTDTNWSAFVVRLGANRNVSEQELISSILSGYIAVFHGAENLTWMPAQPAFQRSIDNTRSESNYNGAMDAFTESLELNLGLLRSHLRSTALRITFLESGTIRKRRLCICSITGKASEAMLNALLTKLSSQSSAEIENLQDLSRLLAQRTKWSLVPANQSTEQPEQAVHMLMEGRIVILLDQMPFALIFPPLLKDIWSVYSDRNFPRFLMLAVRLARIAGMVTAFLLPGLYVALVSINPEVFRIDMALSVAKSREGVPYPPLFEVLIMLFILELVVSASVRLPKSIGPTITMVGGIILGQAAVQAKLVSNLLIIILAATTIANFTLVGFQNALMVRIIKYLNILLCSMFGILGLLVGTIWVMYYLAGISTYNVTYLGMTLVPEDQHE